MKKVLIGILIGILVIVGGCVAITGFSAKSVSDSISQIEQETANKDAEYQKLYESIQWEVKDDGFTKTIEGVLESTTYEAIDYIQFDYKTFDGEGDHAPQYPDCAVSQLEERFFPVHLLFE